MSELNLFEIFGGPNWVWQGVGFLLVDAEVHFFLGSGRIRRGDHLESEVTLRENEVRTNRT